MKLFDYHRTVIAYHGCDESVAESLLNGGSFERSRNKYDWLGEGIYFWNSAPIARWNGLTKFTGVGRSASKSLPSWEPCCSSARVSTSWMFDSRVTSPHRFHS